MAARLKVSLVIAAEETTQMQTQEESQSELNSAEALRRKQFEQWLTENREAVKAYNEFVEAHGVFSDFVRSF